MKKNLLLRELEYKEVFLGYERLTNTWVFSAACFT